MTSILILRPWRLLISTCARADITFNPGSSRIICSKRAVSSLRPSNTLLMNVSSKRRKASIFLYVSGEYAFVLFLAKILFLSFYGFIIYLTDNKIICVNLKERTISSPIHPQAYSRLSKSNLTSRGFPAISANMVSAHNCSSARISR